MPRTRPPSPSKVRRDWPRVSPSANAPRGLLAAFEALYSSTTCELGEAGIAERDQRHRQAEAAHSRQGALALVSKP